jgi:hypothetical protein
MPLSFLANALPSSLQHYLSLAWHGMGGMYDAYLLEEKNPASRLKSVA